MNSRLLLILLLALALRLGFALSQDHLAPYSNYSADTGWYLSNGYSLIMGDFPGETLDYPERFTLDNYLRPYTLVTHRSISFVTQPSQIQTPPLYLILLGVLQALFSPVTAILVVRVVQVLLATATCFFAYRLALRLTGSLNLALLCALIIAVNPVFIIESAQILTETLFVFLLTGGIWLYVESVRARRRAVALLVLAALLLGLATLTRAVLLAFPFGLAVHLLLVYSWRRGLGRAAVLLLVYGLVVSTWTIYTVTQWNRFVIAGEGLPAFIYLGVEGWSGAQQVDQQLAEQSPTGDYIEAAGNSIVSSPLGWVQRRVGELAGAYLQPHGTTFFPGESLRQLALDWLNDDRSLAGLLALTRGDSFWQKLTLYLFHYTALAVGLVGIWRTRRRWRVALPLLGVLAYFTLVHLALYVEPRYLFPLEFFWWVFAVASLYRGAAETERTAA